MYQVVILTNTINWVSTHLVQYQNTDHQSYLYRVKHGIFHLSLGQPLM